jgi:hypothetical protein
MRSSDWYLQDEVDNPVFKFIKMKVIPKFAAYNPKSSTLRRLKNAVSKL